MAKSFSETGCKVSAKWEAGENAASPTEGMKQLSREGLPWSKKLFQNFK